MLEKFNGMGQQIISIAESIAYDMSHSVVGIEHLFLAFIKKRDSKLNELLLEYELDIDEIINQVNLLYSKDTDEVSLFIMKYSDELKAFLNGAIISLAKSNSKVTAELLASQLMKSDNNLILYLISEYEIDLEKLENDLVGTVNYSELDSLDDLHRMNKEKKDPLIGRTAEVDMLVRILRRRNKPNAILIGEPGVGKTAIVEEVASLIAEGKIKELKGKSIFELDLSSTVAGTKYRGEFEDKVKKIIKKVKENGEAILFVDEIHNIVDAGGAEGALDASNILKPYLARGDIQMIGATTIDEYERTFSKDKAFKRRFQTIIVNENTEEETYEILRKIKGIYEQFYHLKIDNEVLRYIVKMAKLYRPNEFFPDKAIEILDNAGVLAKNILTPDDVNKLLNDLYHLNIGSSDNLINLKATLKKKICGQDEAIDKIVAELEGGARIHSFLFVGSSGVGKTEVCRQLASQLASKEDIVILNASLFNGYDVMTKLLGTNENDSKLVRKLKTVPHSIIVFEGIEKASPELIDFIESTLDNGYFMTPSNHQISCLEATFIMTTNYGTEGDRTMINLGEEELALRRKKLLEEKFHYEFISRIDSIVYFKKLSEETIKEFIFKNESKENQLSEFGSSLSFNKTDKENLDKHGFRAVKNIISVNNKIDKELV